MVLAANNSPLVSGGSAGKPAAAGPVRLLRAICIKGERIEADTVLQLDRVTASDLVSSGKAERVTQQAPAVQTPAPASPTKPPAGATPSKKEL